MGGILEVLLANKSEVTAATTSGKVTSITMGQSAKFHKYQFAPETASMSSNFQVNAQNGTKYVQTDLLMVFNRMETAKRVEIMAMAQGELVAIVKDANGVYWFLGMDEPLTLSAGDGLSGTARADRNGYSATLQDNSLELPYEVLVGDGGVDLDAITA
jgi:hypothetical protein